MADRAKKLRDRNLAVWPPDVPLQELGAYVQEGEPERMPGAHAHLEVEINYLLAGRMTYLMAGAQVDLGPGTLAAFWAALPHQLIHVAPGTRCIWVLLPLASVLQAGLPRDLTDALLAGDLLTLPLPPEVPQRWVADLDPAAQRATRLEVQASLLRMRSGATSVSGEPDTVAAMCRYLAAHYLSPIAVADVAAAVGLHPNYAMRLFRAATGMTLGDTLLRHRLAHAQRLLLDSDSPIEVIAAASGFGSTSRFYEAFQQRTGQTPSGYRKRR